MTVQDNPLQAGILVAIFGGLEGLLLQSYETRGQDVRLLQASLGVVLLMILIPAPRAFRASDSTTPTFRRQFAMLSFCEVTFTLVLPWCLLLWDQDQARSLVPHLGFFQGQILGEQILFVTRRKEWLFAFTCVANTCRLYSILFGLREAAYPLDKTLSIVTLLLWLYSSFVFVPFVWYRYGGSPEKLT